MKTEFKFAQALKSLMAEKPLDDISVMALTRKCHVNRQTFYYHFHDIYDLLTLVFLHEKIENIEKCKNFHDLITEIYHYYEANQGFIDATLASAGKDLFQEFLYNACYQSTMGFINGYQVAKTISAEQKKSVARFYASAIAFSICYYLANYKNKTLNKLLNQFAFLNQFTLSKTLQNVGK